MRCSTSSGARPSAVVCTSTWGGANWGNTSRGIRLRIDRPQRVISTAATTTSQRLAMDVRSVWLSRRSSMGMGWEAGERERFGGQFFLPSREATTPAPAATTAAPAPITRGLRPAAAVGVA